MIFEINLIFLIKPFFQHDQKWSKKHNFCGGWESDFMVIKRLSIALKKVESWPKKLHQFFLGYIPTLGQVQYHLKMNLTPISLRSWLASLTKKYLPLQYYTCTEVQAGTTSCSKLTGRTSIILFQYIVSVLKQKELII